MFRDGPSRLPASGFPGFPTVHDHGEVLGLSISARNSKRLLLRLTI